MMTASYDEAVKQIKKQLAAAILEKETGLAERVADFDAALLKLLRSIGQEVMTEVVSTLATLEVAAARKAGFTVEKRDTSFFLQSSGRSKLTSRISVIGKRKRASGLCKTS